MTLYIRVEGIPGPQGSKSYKGQSKKGRAILVESSKKVKPWREAVVAAAKAAMWQQKQAMFTGPVHLTVEFALRAPRRLPKHGLPSKMPDLSKLIRSTEDALTAAGVWKDDALVVSVTARKSYPVEEGREGAWRMSSTGARIWVYPIPDERHLTKELSMLA